MAGGEDRFEYGRPGSEDLSVLAQAYHTREGLRELQGETIPFLLVSLLAVCICLFEFTFAAYEPRSWVASVFSAAVLVTVYRLKHRHVPASAVLIGGLACMLGVLVWLYPGGIPALFFVLVVFTAGVLLGPGEGFVTALFGSAVVLAVWLWSDALSPDMIIVAAVLMWGAAFLSWLSTRPLYTVLDWSWSSYVQALRSTLELRSRQGELVRLSRGLEDAYHRLEKLNVELEQARRDADAARRQKAEFAATISHELRTPLNLILGFSEMMATRPLDCYGVKLPECYRSDVEAIHQSASHITDLIDDVLDLSQIEAHRMALHKEPSSLAEVVDEALAAVRALFEGRGLSLTAEFADNLPQMWLDRGRVRQILINLLANAARFTKQGGATVKVGLDGYQAVLSVSDTGVGIKPEELPRIFEQFHQVDFRASSSYHTSGLGLAISRRFAEMHGGRMWAESTPGVGSTFYLALPLHDATPLLPSDPGKSVIPASLRASRRTVVVVSESHQSFSVIQRYLDDYDVVRAYTPVEASRMLTKHAACALVFTDDFGKDSASAGELGEAVQWSTPVITCSLRTAGEIGRELGAHDYLVKPVTRQQLQASLKRLSFKPRRILVVDDDPLMARLLSRLLHSLARNRHVLVAQDGAEGLQLTREQAPDLVILDLLMPGMSGYEVLEAMRSDERLRRIPVIVVTAKGRDEERVIAKEVRVTRPEGLTVGEAARCLKSSLDIVLSETTDISPALESGDRE